MGVGDVLVVDVFADLGPFEGEHERRRVLSSDPAPHREGLTHSGNTSGEGVRG